MQGLVKGRVQGVFFRLETQQQAIRLGLTGWVRNTVDGHVEVCISGEDSQVTRMLEWLQQGPRLAHVETVELNLVSRTEVDDFQILG